MSIVELKEVRKKEREDMKAYSEKLKEEELQL
jgi:hypothetical protein